MAVTLVIFIWFSLQACVEPAKSSYLQITLDDDVKVDFSTVFPKCLDATSCETNEICIEEHCQCQEGFVLAQNGSCQRCAVQKGHCMSSAECCGDLQCMENDGAAFGLCGEAAWDFMTVAKIALASALIVTMVAVFGVFWRAFMQERCLSYCSGPETDLDAISVNSIQRFVIQRMQDRPPRYDSQQDKPPSYEECVGSAEEGGSGSCVQSIPLTEPPPYTIAVDEAQDASQLPGYVIQETTNPELASTPLNVVCVRLEATALADSLVPSPVTDMEDFVAYSESDSDSFHYHDLNDEDQQHILDSTSTSSQDSIGGVDNPGFSPISARAETQHPFT